MSQIINFGPHKVEIRYSGTGSYSPWYREKHENDQKWAKSFCTADVTYFMRVDDKDIYKITGHNVENELYDIASNYDFYPAEMEGKFRELLKSDKLIIQDPI